VTTVALPEVDDDVIDRLEPFYDLILLDDDDHTYDYVVEDRKSTRLNSSH